MRQIKKFMEAKRPMWNCNECKCITIQCWKENDAFCGCGENITPPVPPTPTTYTVTFEVNPASGGSINVQSVEVEAGTRVSYISSSELEIGGTTVVATAAEGYVNNGWVGPEEIGENTTITADFIEYIPVESITAPEENAIQITEGGEGIIEFGYSPTDATHVFSDIIYTGSDDAIAYVNGINAEDGVCRLSVLGVAPGNCTITYSLSGTSYSVDVEVTPGL